MAWTKAELEAYAADHDVDIAGLTTKQEILDAIQIAAG